MFLVKYLSMTPRNGLKQWKSLFKIKKKKREVNIMSGYQMFYHIKSKVTTKAECK